MRTNGLSLTALWVAAARSLPRARGGAAADAVTPQRLPWPLSRVLEKLARLAERQPRLARVLSQVSLGLVEYISLRTLAIDARVEDAVRTRGLQQMVVLGAGFDSRAFRLACLDDCTVYEVDHPATAAHKREPSHELPLRAARRYEVLVDFERGELDERLERAGHVREQPTLWLWEGVTMYLTEVAVRATLATLAARSAPGSELILSYGPPGFLPPPQPRVLSLLGEPLQFLPTSARLAEILAEYKFFRETDDGVLDWQVRFGEQAPVRARERVASAVFRPKDDDAA